LTKNINKISTRLKEQRGGFVYLKFDKLNNLRLMGEFLAVNLKVVKISESLLGIAPLY